MCQYEEYKMKQSFSDGGVGGGGWGMLHSAVY